jgi:hypothetical protein
MSFEFKIDLQAFKKSLKGIEINLAKAAKKSLYHIGEQIVKDAVTKPPTPRIDTGNLRGGWSISVGGQVLVENKKSGSLAPEITGMKNLELRVGFNMPYALQMERGIRNGKEIGFGVKSIQATPRTGNHFLGSKIRNKGKLYEKRLQEMINLEFNK